MYVYEESLDWGSALAHDERLSCQALTILKLYLILYWRNGALLAMKDEVEGL